MIAAVPDTAAWDRIDPDALISLVGIRRMPRRFGVLLRHYWMPATQLRYEKTVTERGCDQPDRFQTVRRMVRCDADTCWWREKTTCTENGVARLWSVSPQEQLCIYNRLEQTFRTRDILVRESLPESIDDARIQAFLRQPVLTPLTPIPVGFRWHVRSETGYMEYFLPSETNVNGMPVLWIRRQGTFEIQEYYRNGEKISGNFTVEREGVTAFALERSMILEDRTHDRVGDSFEQWSILTLEESALVPQE